MALDEFWSNLRTAVSHYAPTRLDDPTQVEPAEAERRWRDARLWLTPRTTEGYNPSDFSFLDETQQVALRESVERFRAVVGQVLRNKPPTRQQAAEGGSALDGILRVLDPYRFWESEVFRTQILLQRELAGQLPDWVTDVSCEFGTDLADDPAIWIQLDVTDEAVDKRRIKKHGRVIDQIVEEAYRRTGGRRWVYIRYRSPDAFARKQEPA